MGQKLFRATYINDLIRKLDTKEGLNAYGQDHFEVDEQEILENPNIQVKSTKLILPESKDFPDFENSKILFEAYKSLSPTEATDTRIWTYLSHVTYWEYTKKRSPGELKKEYILEHWFIKSLTTANLLRQNISLLWWVSYLTYDKDRSDPYELTREAFSMLDYTRHLFAERIGGNNIFVHAVLEFVIKHKELFSKFKETKVRYLISKSNFIGGYKILPSLSKNELDHIFESLVGDISKISGR